MKDPEREFNEKAGLILISLVAVFLVLDRFDLKQYWPLITDLATSLVLAFATTAIAQAIIIRFTGNNLETKYFKIKINGWKFKVSFFVVATILLKLTFF
ncbi:MAG: hypothetical protein ABIC95_05980 [archaeon]